MTFSGAPLPGGWADELLWHAQTCPACQAIRNSPGIPGRMCPRGQQLVRLTLEERHGRIDHDD